MLKFIVIENKKTNILTEQEGIMLGYIDENNIFFPNNNMMFKVEWLEKIAGYMHKHGTIQLGEIYARYTIKDVEF